MLFMMGITSTNLIFLFVWSQYRLTLLSPIKHQIFQSKITVWIGTYTSNLDIGFLIKYVLLYRMS